MLFTTWDAGFCLYLCFSLRYQGVYYCQAGCGFAVYPLCTLAGIVSVIQICGFSCPFDSLSIVDFLNLAFNLCCRYWFLLWKCLFEVHFMCIGHCFRLFEHYFSAVCNIQACLFQFPEHIALG